MCESTILCHITGPNVDLSKLVKCMAGRDWTARELCGQAHEHPAFDAIIAGSAGVKMKIYSDDSAFVEYSRWNVLIIAAGCVREWVENEYGNARQFADVSWEDDPETSGDVIHRGLKAMLIYCIGEKQAIDWFVGHGGSVASKKFCISDGELQSLIRLMREPDFFTRDEQLRFADFLEGLKPVE